MKALGLTEYGPRCGKEARLGCVFPPDDALDRVLRNKDRSRLLHKSVPLSNVFSSLQSTRRERGGMTSPPKVDRSRLQRQRFLVALDCGVSQSAHTHRSSLTPPAPGRVPEVPVGPALRTAPTSSSSSDCSRREGSRLVLLLLSFSGTAGAAVPSPAILSRDGGMKTRERSTRISLISQQHIANRKKRERGKSGHRLQQE
jgi:hypothetical protein